MGQQFRLCSSHYSSLKQNVCACPLGQCSRSSANTLNVVLLRTGEQRAGSYSKRDKSKYLFYYQAQLCNGIAFHFLNRNANLT